MENCTGQDMIIEWWSFQLDPMGIVNPSFFPNKIGFLCELAAELYSIKYEIADKPEVGLGSIDRGLA